MGGDVIHYHEDILPMAFKEVYRKLLSRIKIDQCLWNLVALVYLSLEKRRHSEQPLYFT